jgi:hypothetical protein
MSMRVKPPIPREAEVQRAIVAVLKFHGLKVWRSNTGAFTGEHNGRKRFIRFGEPGMSDLFALLPTGRFACVEVKRPGAKPTPAQLAFLMEINAAGGFALWASSAATVDHAIRAVLLNPKLRIEVRPDGSMDLTDEEEVR